MAGPRRPGGVKRRGDMIPVEFLQQATSKINQADAGTGIQTEAAFIYREKKEKYINNNGEFDPGSG